MKTNALTLVGTAIALAVTSSAAFAQSTGTTSSPAEIVLTEEQTKLLCEIFPLNSRCAGAGKLDVITPSGTTQPSQTTPSQTAPMPPAGSSSTDSTDSPATSPSGEMTTPTEQVPDPQQPETITPSKP